MHSTQLESEDDVCLCHVSKAEPTSPPQMLPQKILRGQYPLLRRVMRWWSSNLLKQPGWRKEQMSVSGFIDKLPFQNEQGGVGCGVICSLTAYLTVRGQRCSPGRGDLYAAPSSVVSKANHQKQLRERKKK